MTPYDRELALRIRQQAIMGPGLFLNDPEFKAWACRTYGIDEIKLTQLMKEVLAS